MCQVQDRRRELARLTPAELEAASHAALRRLAREGTADARREQELCWWECYARGRRDVWARAEARAAAANPYTEGGG